MKEGAKMNKEMKRRDWDERYLKLALYYSENATCNRAKVGCIITRGNIQLSEGYNGSVSGDPHCTEVGCLKNEEGRCIRCLHAEENAIINAMKKGVNIEGGTAYVTHEPCEGCTRRLRQAGITRIVFQQAYANKYNHHFIGSMEWVHLPLEETL